MLERLQKLNLKVRYHVANYKNDQDSINTAKEWQLLNHFIQLLEPFFIGIKECSKNNAMLSSVIPHAMFVNIN